MRLSKMEEIASIENITLTEIDYMSQSDYTAHKQKVSEYKLRDTDKANITKKLKQLKHGDRDK